MKDFGELFDTFIEDIAPLGEKRGPLLCQLPPSLAFDADVFGTGIQDDVEFRQRTDRHRTAAQELDVSRGTEPVRELWDRPRFR